MIALSKIKNLINIKNLIILSLTAASFKLLEQLIKGKYFHDFEVYFETIKTLNNAGNPYINSLDLPYLYPPLISSILSTFNNEIFSFIYISIYITLIFLLYFLSNKKFRISFLISIGISGILIKSLLTGNISNIFYILLIFSVIYYSKYKNFLPFYTCVFFISLIKFNFIILFLLPILINKNLKKELINFIICVSSIFLIYFYQYKFINTEFINFFEILRSSNSADYGSSLFSFLNYRLNLGMHLSILIHSSLFIFLIGFVLLNKNKIDFNLYLLLILILLIFSNPRLKLYDVAFGVVLLNTAILYFSKTIILNFYTFNLVLIFIFKLISKNFELHLENPKMLSWYIFILFIFYFLKKYFNLRLIKPN